MLAKKSLSRDKIGTIKREKNQIKQINETNVRHTDHYLGNRKTINYIKSMGNVSEDFQRMPVMDQNREMQERIGKNFRLRDQETKDFANTGKLNQNRGKNKMPLKGDLLQKLFKGLSRMSGAIKNSVKGDKEKEYQIMKRDRLMKPHEKIADNLTDKVMFMLKKLPKEENNQDQEATMKKQINIFKMLNLTGINFTELFKSNGDISKQKEILYKNLKM